MEAQLPHLACFSFSLIPFEFIEKYFQISIRNYRIWPILYSLACKNELQSIQKKILKINLSCS